MAIFWKSRMLLAKLEATEGVDPVPTPATDAILVKDVSFNPMEGEDRSRELELPYFGWQGTLPVELHATLSFKVELAPSGVAGTAPAWGKLLRACAVAETISAGTSVTYNPITDGQESITFYLLVGDTLMKMVGARGTGTFQIDAQNNPHIMFEFTSLYVSPVTQALAAADFSAWTRPQVATTQNTPTISIGGTSFVTRSIEMDLANQVEPRFLIGSSGILITGKEETLAVTVEAVPLTAFDPFAAAENQTELAVSVVHGTGAGRITTLSLPKAQMQRPGQPSNSQGIVEWPLRMVPIPTAGNDQWTLTLT